MPFCGMMFVTQVKHNHSMASAGALDGYVGERRLRIEAGSSLNM